MWKAHDRSSVEIVDAIPNFCYTCVFLWDEKKNNLVNMHFGVLKEENHDMKLTSDVASVPLSFYWIFQNEAQKEKVPI